MKKIVGLPSLLFSSSSNVSCGKDRIDVERTTSTEYTLSNME